MVFSATGLVFTRSIMIGAGSLQGDFEKWKEKFAREVKQSLDTCLSESPGLGITKLLLAGAAVHIPSLVTYLGPQLGLQPECLDSLQSLKRLPATPSLQDSEFHAISMTALAGLALRPDELRINLVPDNVSTRRALVRKSRTLTTMVMLLMTMITFAAVFAVTKVALRAGQLDEVEKAIAASAPQVALDEQMREVVHLVAARSESRLAPVVLLREIRASTPSNTFLDAVDLNYEQNQVMVSGTADTIKDVRALVQNLEQKDVFKDVAEGQTKKVAETGRFKFQIACALEARK
jgi:Tfp pilus assembly protein PilN